MNTSGPPHYSGAHKPRKNANGRPPSHTCSICHSNQKRHLSSRCRSCDHKYNQDRYQRIKAERQAELERVRSEQL